MCACLPADENDGSFGSDLARECVVFLFGWFSRVRHPWLIGMSSEMLFLSVYYVCRV